MMNTTNTIDQRFTSLRTAATRAVLALLSAGLVMTVSIGIFLLGMRAFHAKRALPGVSYSGIDLTGMTEEEIRVELDKALTYPQMGLIALHDADQLWALQPVDLGVVIDTPTMARLALAVGRQGNFLERVLEQIDSLYLGHPISSIIIFDQLVGSINLQGLAQGIDRPTLEATLNVNGIEIEMRPGQIGRRLKIQDTLDELTDPISLLHDTNINLVIEEMPPVVLDASAQADIAREILRTPLVLTAEGAGPWVIEPLDLAEMLLFDITDDDGYAHYVVRFDSELLASILEPLSDELERKSKNARFYFDDDTHELVLIQEAVIGRSLDIAATIDGINTGLTSGQHEIPLVFRITEPAVGDDATAAELGISEPVSVVSTYFMGSSTSRKQNIKTASSAFHGLLIAPGETLSMAEVLGDISLDTGYAEALIIFGDRTIKGVGGGVCQVSTTLFRAAFFGGYPIEERHPHAYRVAYYELTRSGSRDTRLVGLDATVFVPRVDFKFTNDRQHWLLLETYIYGNQLLWKFYSTSDDRTVNVSSPNIANEIEAPEPLYRENPDLPEDTIEKVDYEADGMDVVVYRTVTLNGEVLYQDTLKTHYLPWREINEYGPGTELPEDAKTE